MGRGFALSVLIEFLLESGPGSLNEDMRGDSCT